ncbi:uncharacterized protein LOC127239327 [Andrographis paniculata]|uniref:uncharacterized protein LOC127239327 n=1 Tax=Andrographis paniculata TaxID=175694 RepID=UPI0021E8F931|nr:uncharacterized protein LOC127239327 [Andrographis paniculata]
MESTGVPSTSTESKTGANIPSENSSSYPNWWPYMSLFPTPVIEPLELHLSPEENTHGLSTTMIEKRWRIFFRLLQRSEPLHCYILEMHEVDSGKLTRYESTVHAHEVTTRIVAMGEHITTMPMVQIFNPVHLQRRSMLTISKRLGNWIVEQRKSNDSERRDKYYIHTIMGKKFRSINEVMTFILCDVFVEDLKMG